MEIKVLIPEQEFSIQVDVPSKPPEDPPGDVWEPQKIVGAQNFVWEDKKIVGSKGDIGGLILENCSRGSILRFDISKSRFSGLWLKNCQDIVVEGGRFHDNGRQKGNTRVGHGIFISGPKTKNIRINGVECDHNWEDGAQQNKDLPPDFLGVYEDCGFHNNGENGFDGKGGNARFLKTKMWDNGHRQKGMEAVVLHNNFVSAEFEECDLKLLAGEHYAGVINGGDKSGVRVKVRGGVLSVNGADSFVLEKGNAWDVEGAELIGSPKKPAINVGGSLRLVENTISSPYAGGQKALVFRGDFYPLESLKGALGSEGSDFYVRGNA